MNFLEIVKTLQDSNITVDDFAYNCCTYPESIGKVEEVVQHGGEGEGEDWYSVKFFVDHNIYIKVSGNYYSHHGTDFEDWEDAVREVTPREKTIKVYE